MRPVYDLLIKYVTRGKTSSRLALGYYAHYQQGREAYRSRGDTFSE